MKPNTLRFVAAGVASLVIATSALASTAPVPSERVSYADLNLDTPAGRARLESRLRMAAADVCGRADFRDLTGVTLAQACVARTLAGALAEVHGATHVQVARL